MRSYKGPRSSSPDFVFLGFLAIIVVFGLVMLSSASSDLAKTQFGNSMYYLEHQMINGLGLGIIGFLVGYFVYYRVWEKFSLFILLGGIVSLLLVFTPLGIHIKGGDRWINIGTFSFQPGELMKLTFLIYLSAWVGKSQDRSKSITGGLVPFSVLIGAVMLLLILQPATSTAALIFGASLLTYFVAGARPKFFVLLALVGALALSLLIYFTPYRMQRFATFLNPEQNQLTTGYHINQALLAIGSGGITGVGFGKSTTKLHYLPEPIGDSIFAVIAEELGFIGAFSLIIFFLAFVWRGLKIAAHAPDGFGRLMVTGFICIIGLQTFVNIAAISGVIPLTGVPLPFISYGGTALAVFLTMSGIIANVSRYRKNKL